MIMDSENSNKILIRKYLNQQCTPQEMEKVKKLMGLPNVQELFDEVLEESWTGLTPEDHTDQSHLDQQLRKFHKKAGTTQISDHQVETQLPVVIWLRKNRRFLSHAAVWLVLTMSCIGYGIIRYRKSQLMVMREMANPYGQRSEIILPDKSEVFLGAGSKLTVPEKFTGDLREVKLEGEAFFQVTKNPLKPFVIHTGTVQTRVLGTSFKIEAFNNKPLVVAVATGKVRVDRYWGHNHQSLAILTPGQTVTYNEGKSILGTIAIYDVLSWKDGRQVFKNRPLKDITDVLERWYNVKFQYLNVKKSTDRISIVLQSKSPLLDVMDVLSATGHFKYVIKGKKYTIN